ncbi:MAG: hypothetical protein Q6354_01875, partial [Candidatus Brocadiales bacterium]|nr:hypothetical protein [Candidatus Brocadiales bacterium]
DAYEAMTTHRPYRKTMASEAAFEKLRAGAGTQFDPNLIEPFIKAIKKLLSTTRRIYIPQLNKMVDIA